MICWPSHPVTKDSLSFVYPTRDIDGPNVAPLSKVRCLVLPLGPPWVVVRLNSLVSTLRSLRFHRVQGYLLPSPLTTCLSYSSISRRLPRRDDTVGEEGIRSRLLTSHGHTFDRLPPFQGGFSSSVLLGTSRTSQP